MSAVIVMPEVFRTKQVWAIILLVLMSTIVVAQTVERLESSPDYDDLSREEIFNSNTEWRTEPPAENEFRADAPVPRSSSRIQIGTNPDYEEIRKRDESLRNTQQHEFGGDRPSTILRFSF
jgi:hypothetical protein